MIRRILVGVLAAAVLLIAWMAYEFVLTRGGTPPIEGDRAVAELTTVELGGVEQWVLVRGTDRRNPVLLWLHGGPGMPTMYLAHAFQRGIERDFVVVHWDRAGAGKSYDAAADRPLSVSGTLQETFQLTRWLRERFGEKPIYLVGHSWGSYLGLLAVRDRPEYYTAFIGTGVLSGRPEEARSIRRAWLRREAATVGDTDVLERLAAGGAATETDLFRYGGELRGATSFWPILRTGLAAPEYTLIDAVNVGRGAQEVARRMEYDVTPTPDEPPPSRLSVPVAFFLGRHDYNTPSELAAGYLDGLDAPHRELVWFEESAHFPFLSQSESFRAALLSLHRSLEAGDPATR